jgi:thiamine-monophosphate kinase
MDEFEIIKKYFQKISKNNPSALQLNDDVFFDRKNKLVVSVDNYNEGIHFPNFKFPNLIIKKILRSSISDLISKGVKPKYYFISGSGNKNHFTKKNLKKISKSLLSEQKKYKIKLSGGDTTFSKKASFCIISIGFSDKIIFRNKAKFNDDIYVTGNIGDSYLGLLALNKKIKINKNLKKYFVNKYYCPNLPFYICNHLNKFANTSIDISDGLFSDLEKLINEQNLSCEVDFNKIPISPKLKNYIYKSKRNKKNYLSNGDDYQILFTAPVNKRSLIHSFRKKMNQKITRIGKILKSSKKKLIKINNKPQNFNDFKGYSHKF